MPHLVRHPQSPRNKHPSAHPALWRRGCGRPGEGCADRLALSVEYRSTGDLQGPEQGLGSLVGWEAVGTPTSAAGPLPRGWGRLEMRHRSVTVLPEKGLGTLRTAAGGTALTSVLFFSLLGQQLLCGPNQSERLPETTVISFPFINCLGDSTLSRGQVTCESHAY